MALFDDNFYPTPDEVIDRMVKPYAGDEEFEELFHGKTYKRRMRWLPFKRILEPSAGKGNICDRLVKHYGVAERDIYCIERNLELQDTLRGKRYKVIDSDFLLYGDALLFDFIIMNPPFSDGASHLLKAWEVLDHGHIACILNAETLRNPYTDERKMLARLIDAFGSHEPEYIEGAFANAERPTDVEIVLVWLEKPKKESAVPDFDTTRMDFDARVEEPEFQENQLARADVIASIVDQYNAALVTLKEMHKLDRVFNYYTREVRVSKFGGGKGEQKEWAERDEKEDEERAPQTLNDKIMELKAQFWEYVFRKTKLGSITTSNFQRKFQETSNQIAQMAFTVDNILLVLETFMFNREQIVMECIFNVFDEATRYVKENREYVEGWVSNDDYRMAQKLIWPSCVVYKGGRSWSIGYYRQDFLMDMDKALCFLTGRSLDKERDPAFTSIVQAMERHINGHIVNGGNYADEFESTFFRIRFYKKGTAHLIMKDKELLGRFNQVAAQGRMWVSAGKKKSST
jgi:hypothetical protein